MKLLIVKGLIYAIELPIILCLLIVLLLFALAHWIDDEWIGE